MLFKVDLSSTFCNNFFFQLETLEFVARSVEHVVAIQETMLFNLQHNNVAKQAK